MKIGVEHNVILLCSSKTLVVRLFQLELFTSFLTEISLQLTFDKLTGWRKIQRRGEVRGEGTNNPVRG